MTNQTTPRPWTIYRRCGTPGRVAPVLSWEIRGSDGHSIADLRWNNLNVERGECNADLIVRAVNAYDELVAAFEKIDAFLTDVETSNPGYLGKLVLQDYMQFNEAMIARTKAKAALARAGKGE